MTRLRFCGLVLAAAAALSCQNEVRPPIRAPGVPESAVWAGGLDGGAWIDCAVDSERNANRCTIYNDQTGGIRKSGLFVLASERRAIVGAEMQFSGFDGSIILLADGRALTPLEPAKEKQ